MLCNNFVCLHFNNYVIRGKCLNVCAAQTIECETGELENE